MRVKKAIQKDFEIQSSLTEKRMKESISVCSWIVQDLLKNLECQLPPNTERVLTYSGLVMKKTTQKIVDINLLESEYLNNFTINNNDRQFFEENPLQNNLQDSQFIDDNDIVSPCRQTKRSMMENQSRVCSPKLQEDEEIIRKKQGVKFVKKQQLKNLIKHRSSNTFSSSHCSYNPTYQRIPTKHSLYQGDFQKPQNTSIQSQTRSVCQNPNQIAVVNSNCRIPSLEQVKSIKNFSTMKQMNKRNEENRNLKNEQKEINRQRISAMMNLGQFVNLEEYYQQKNKQLNRNKYKITFKQNYEFFKGQKDKSNDPLLRKNSNIYHSTWAGKQAQCKDQDDIIINKLRERKQKFYRTQNNFNGDSFVDTNRKTTIINASQKNSQKDQYGAIIAFDYNGLAMPTVKYDTLKIAQHYQDMDFAVVHHDDSLLKRKKQRKGYMFGNGINLKLVDHQKFLPHPSNHHQPLVQNQGILMKQNIGYLLKKGVQIRSKQQNNSSSLSGVNDQDQTRERINKGNFQFLHNEQAEPKGVKFQQFLRYKKATLTSNKNITSRKRIGDQTSMWEDSLLSKKSISIKTLKNKPILEDGTNKVHKSANPKALQMLINGNNIDIVFKPETTVNFERIETCEVLNEPNGVLKKSPLNGFHKPMPQQIDSNVPKKKVRIA